MSQAGASLLVVAVMFVLAVYILIWPPEGFDENLAYRVVLPFVLVCGAYGVLENQRTRAHMAQLIGALRSHLRTAPDPRAKAEAIEILVQSLKSDQASVRKTASEQLRNLTGQDHGEDHQAWSKWWAENKSEFGRKSG